MTTPSYSALSSISPTVSNFVDQVIQDLVLGKSTVVLLPSVVASNEMEDLIDRYIWQRSLDVRKLYLDHTVQQQSLVSMVTNSLGLEWLDTEARTTQNLLRKDFEFDILFIFGLEVAPAEIKQECRMLVERWAERAKSQHDSGEHFPGICIVTQAMALLPDLPKEDVNLSIYWWWGLPSMLEMHLFARTIMDYTGEDAELRWRESVLPQIAATDLTLFLILWEHTSGSIDDAFDLLCQYAQQHGWSNIDDQITGLTDQQYVNRLSHQTFLQGPPFQLREPWARGMLTQTFEYGIEEHPAILAVRGQNDSLNHRIWRGQASLLLPQLDYIRLNLCKHFTSLYGPKWPLWLEPANRQEIVAVDENPLSCQWGHLKRLIDECEKLASHAALVPLVRHARRLRNTLSHYGIVSFEDYRLLSSYTSQMESHLRRH